MTHRLNYPSSNQFYLQPAMMPHSAYYMLRVRVGKNFLSYRPLIIIFCFSFEATNSLNYLTNILVTAADIPATKFECIIKWMFDKAKINN